MKRFMLSILVAFMNTFILFAEEVEVKVVAEGNGRVRVKYGEDQSEYQTETTLSCEVGSTIEVEIESMDNFIGWGGWGKSSDRSIKTSPKVKTIKIDKATTITAYFINSIKDNLILNGDFSLVSNLSSSLSDAERKLQIKNQYQEGRKFIVESLDRLTAGEWYLDYQEIYDDNKYARTGLLIVKEDWYSNLAPYDTKSLTLALGGKKGTSSSLNSKVRCLINIPCGGEYKLVFKHEVGYHTTYMWANGWKVLVYLKDDKGNRCLEKIINYKSKSSPSYSTYSIEQINIPRGGVYELFFELDRPTITNGSGSTTYSKYAHVAYDNLSFNFVRGRGFSVKIR